MGRHASGPAGVLARVVRLSSMQSRFSGWTKPLPVTKKDEKKLMADLHSSFARFMDSRHPNPTAVDRHFQIATCGATAPPLAVQQADVAELRSSPRPLRALADIIRQPTRFRPHYVDVVLQRAVQADAQDALGLLDSAAESLGFCPASIKPFLRAPHASHTAAGLLRLTDGMQSAELDRRVASLQAACAEVWIPVAQSTRISALDADGVVSHFGYVLRREGMAKALALLLLLQQQHARAVNAERVCTACGRMLLREAARRRDKATVLAVCRAPWFASAIAGQEAGMARWLLAEGETDAAWHVIRDVSHQQKMAHCGPQVAAAYDSVVLELARELVARGAYYRALQLGTASMETRREITRLVTAETKTAAPSQRPASPALSKAIHILS